MTTCLDCDAPIERTGRRGPSPVRCPPHQTEHRARVKLAWQQAHSEARARAQREAWAAGYRAPSRGNRDRKRAVEVAKDWKAANPEAAAGHAPAAQMRARAKRAGATILETFPAIEIFERDAWTCRICGLPTDEDSRWLYATVDHVVPLAKGGQHTRGNVQTAHWLCNLRKRDAL